MDDFALPDVAESVCTTSAVLAVLCTVMVCLLLLLVSVTGLLLRNDEMTRERSFVIEITGGSWLAWQVCNGSSDILVTRLDASIFSKRRK